MLDREGRVLGVRDQRPPGVGRATQPVGDLPVPGTGHESDHPRVLTQRRHLVQG